MSSLAPFDQMQEDYAQRHDRAVKLTAARSLLNILDVPHPGDAPLTYVGVLRRLYTVIATEIEAQGDESHA